MSVVIRDADLARDKPSIQRFMAGLNLFESAFEPNRDLAPGVPERWLKDLLARVRAKQGRMFVADDGGVLLGWAACHADQYDVYVREEDRAFGYVEELYVDEAARGRHIGRALLKACEDHFRSLGLKSVLIGALNGNARAIAAYRAAGYSDYAVNLRKLL
ncbi:MAG: GNAT family N-acetyltransferase [Alphaproteobacteria bacterium]|nr:GNAT family N-acetyltransferase [Alphaproteobacteria bacterium]